MPPHVRHHEKYVEVILQYRDAAVRLSEPHVRVGNCEREVANATKNSSLATELSTSIARRLPSVLKP